MANELTITLSGDDGAVSVTALIEALENTIQVLRSLEAQHGLAETIRWEIVRATMQSPLTLTIAAKVMVGSADFAVLATGRPPGSPQRLGRPRVPSQSRLPA